MQLLLEALADSTACDTCGETPASTAYGIGLQLGARQVASGKARQWPNPRGDKEAINVQ